MDRCIITLFIYLSIYLLFIFFVLHVGKNVLEVGFSKDTCNIMQNMEAFLVKKEFCFFNTLSVSIIKTCQFHNQEYH